MNQQNIYKEAQQAATAFLTAFDQLEWEAFCAAIAPDATIFMPWPRFPNRLEGIEQITTAFHPLFEELPLQKDGPPYLNLHPLNLDIQLVGISAAIVTFHLDEVDHYARRTAVFEKRADQWLLIHLHASNMPPKESLINYDNG